jgi:AcrR family transcriptional regulator
MTRCIVYSSVQTAALTPSDVHSMAAHALAKNRAIGVTGRLVADGNRFVQLIEGTRATIGRLYQAIESDSRHRDVLCLLDHEFDEPLYRDWAYLLPQPSPQDQIAFTRSLPRPLADPVPAVGLLEDGIAALTRTRHGASLLQRLKVVPRQLRAAQTVDQIFIASEAALKRHGLVEFSLDQAARAAKVTLTSAYRYFSGTENLLRAICHRRQVIAFNNALEAIARMSFRSEREVAAWVVDEVIDRLMRGSRIHPPTFRLLYRDYHDVLHDALWSIAEALLAAMLRGGMRCDDISVQQLSMALASTGGGVKNAFLRDPALIETPAIRQALIAGFLGVLGTADA